MDSSRSLMYYGIYLICELLSLHRVEILLIIFQHNEDRMALPKCNVY